MARGPRIDLGLCFKRCAHAPQKRSNSYESEPKNFLRCAFSSAPRDLWMLFLKSVELFSHRFAHNLRIRNIEHFRRSSQPIVKVFAHPQVEQDIFPRHCRAPFALYVVFMPHA